MDDEWAGGRRTDGIAVMEVPVYDPSDRKRKSHERQCDERAKEIERASEREREERGGGERSKGRSEGESIEKAG